MLEDVLTSDDKNALAAKHFRALSLFGEMYNTKKKKLKHKYLYPVRKAGFSILEAKNMNFLTNKYMWKSCLNRRKRNNGGHPKLDNSLIEKINSRVAENSTIAANRYLKKQNQNALYRNSTLKEAYNNLPEKNKLSYSSFYLHLDNRFKKPHRLSDLCDYCEYKKVIFYKYHLI